MKTESPFTDIAGLEKELAEIAPLGRQGFRHAGAPSPQVADAIRAEARRYALRTQARSAWPLYRRLTAVAAVALMVGGTIQYHISRQADLKAAEEARLTKTGIAENKPKTAENNTPGLANLLLEIQGLNEDGFFRPEEAEPLWQ